MISQRTLGRLRAPMHRPALHPCVPAVQVVGMVGATLGTAMAFVFPGMLALRDAQGGHLYRAFGWALLLAGGVLTVLGVASTDDG